MLKFIRSNVTLHEIKELLIHLSNAFIIAPEQADVNLQCRSKRPSHKVSLLLGYKIRQYRNAHPVSHQLLYCLQLRCTKQDIRNKAAIYAAFIYMLILIGV